MANNKPIDKDSIDEINLTEIVATIINSKKLIILFTLLAALVTFGYTAQNDTLFYKSTVLLDVRNDGSTNIIDNFLDPLIKDLHVELIYKKSGKIKNISIESLQDRLIRISYISPSVDANQNFLKEM